MKVLHSVIMVLGALVWPGPAHADLPSAREAYAAGDFARAETLASADPSAEAQAFAAGAALALLMTGEAADRRAVAHRLSGHARDALSTDGNHAEAHLRMAAAIGFEGRYAGVLRAFMRRLPQQGKSHIEQALQLDPGDPWGPAMLGAWHFEVVRRGGGRALGASLEEGVAAYTRAVTSAPDDPAIAYFYAVALLAGEEPAHRALARSELERAAALAPRSGLERALDAAMIGRSGALLATLESDPAQATRLAIAEMEA